MDLPDVDIVVQWKATCNMCDLWQRFGRAARAPGMEATGILFVEKAHLDDARELKKTNAEAKKRKAIDDGNRPAKRSAVMGSSSNVVDESDLRNVADRGIGITNPSQEAQDLEIAEREAHRVAAYNRRPQGKIAGIKKSKSRVDTVELYGPIDDFVNAATREEVGPCRRQPVKLYFGGKIRPSGERPNLSC